MKIIYPLLKIQSELKFLKFEKNHQIKKMHYSTKYLSLLYFEGKSELKVIYDVDNDEFLKKMRHRILLAKNLPNEKSWK